MHKGIFIILLFTLSAATSHAKDTSVVFSSRYTYIDQKCEWAYPQSELVDGQDNALVCKGFGRYQIYVYFSASDAFFSIHLKDDPDNVILNPAIGGIDVDKGVIEWRMANGKPFAIIVRSKEYSDMESRKKPLKESLFVRGIEKYSEISGSVNVRNNKHANDDARMLADNGYKRITNR